MLEDTCSSHLSYSELNSTPSFPPPCKRGPPAESAYLSGCQLRSTALEHLSRKRMLTSQGERTQQVESGAFPPSVCGNLPSSTSLIKAMKE